MEKTTRFVTSFYRKIRLVWRILNTINRSGELKRLITWARRRRFNRVQANYEDNLVKVESILMLLRREYPRQYLFARILHGISNLVSVKPGYYASHVHRYNRR